MYVFCTGLVLLLARLYQTGSTACLCKQTALAGGRLTSASSRVSKPHFPASFSKLPAFVIKDLRSSSSVHRGPLLSAVVLLA